MNTNKKRKLIKKAKQKKLKQLTLVAGLTMMTSGVGILGTNIKADQVTIATESSTKQVDTTDSTPTVAQSSSASQTTTASADSLDSTANETTTTSQAQSQATTSAQSQTATSEVSDSAKASSSLETEETNSSSSFKLNESSQTSDSAEVTTNPTTSVATITSENNEPSLNSSEVDSTSTTSANQTSVTLDTSTLVNQGTNLNFAQVLAVNTTDYFQIGDPRYTSVDAVDISSYQYWMGQSEFNQLKALGVSTVIVKLTEGNYYTNPNAADFIRYARNAGLNIAIYHYVKFATPGAATAEGNYLAGSLRNHGLAGDTLIFADIEDASTLVNSSYNNAVNSLNAFWSALSNNGFTNHAVYVYQAYLYRDAVVSTVGRDRTWLAQYPFTPSRGGYFEQLHSNEGYGAWQFASTAYLPGKNGRWIDVSHDYNGLLTKAKEQNLAAFDDISLHGSTLHVSGWHATDKSKGQGYASLIVYDKTQNREITRVSYTPGLRNDVYNAYSNIYNSRYSGFDVNVDLSPYNLANDTIQIVARYSNQPNGNGEYTDVWSEKYTFNQNMGDFNKVELVGTNLHITGWHAADASALQKYAYIILYDATTNRELKRISYSPQKRNDVYAQHPEVYNASNSGFDVNFDLRGLDFAGHNLQLVARFSNDRAGNGSYTDIWSKKYNFNQNMAFFDKVEFNGSQLHVTGWHAADASAVKPYSYIILYDATTNRELKRVSYTGKPRADVQRVYSNLYNASNSGFDVNFDLRGLDFAGHNLQLVARFSNDRAGNGSYTDVWSRTYNFNHNNGYIDNISTVSANKIAVSGWHVADKAAVYTNPWIIVFDKTANRELGRSKYTPVLRNDVQSVYHDTYNAVASGFSNVTVTLNNSLNSINNHELQIVMRYSNNSYNGEGSYQDFYSKVYYVRNNRIVF
ncbi:GH25 family lysozyme [Ligilactobacillus agilis]|uniref:GH25 family lysozyme n=2 Tax=Ligilactobacillus agilis TaxID=1601 RepID=UPI0022E60DF0|nr:GH25 family lysozyme [Ligilactobacillus agilis]